MKRKFTQEELVQKVLTSNKIELKGIYPADGLYLDPQKEPRALCGFVINDEFFADEYSGEVFKLDDPYLTDVENMDEFDF